MSAHEPCPFCGKTVCTSGGGISNHIARTASCRQQRDTRAKTISHRTGPFASKDDGLHHTQGLNNEYLGMGNVNSELHGGVKSNIDPSGSDAYNTPTPELQVEANIGDGMPASDRFVVYEDENAGHIF